MNWHIPKDRFYLIAFLLFLMWMGIMLFYYLKADEVTKHPCSVCAKRIGVDVKCTTYGVGLVPIDIVFYKNGSRERIKDVGS